MKKIIFVCALALCMPALEAFAFTTSSAVTAQASSARIKALKPGSGSMVNTKMLTVWSENGTVYYRSDSDLEPQEATACNKTIKGQYCNYCTRDGYYFNYGG